MDDSTDPLQLVTTLRPAWRPDDLSGFRWLEGGYANRNYRFEHRGSAYVLRVPSRARPFIDRELERAFYRAPGDVRVPEIEAFDPASGAMITRWLDGALLVGQRPEPGVLVAYVEALHRGLPRCPRTYDPVAIAREQLEVGTPAREILALAKRTQWSPPATTTCHNDLNPWNIVSGADGQWTTLDWEWLGNNDPVFDLVTLHQGLGLDDAILSDLAQALVGGARPRRRVRECLSAFWLREHAWAHAELAFGNDRPEIREQLRVSAEKLGALD